MQKRSEMTRARILEVATTLFSQQGYEATGVAEICHAAGVSKGAFYHHFSTKQAIFLELLEDWLNRLDIAFEQTRQGTQTVTQSIEIMAGIVGNIYQTADINLSILLEFWTQAQRDPMIWQKAIAPYRRYQTYFSSLLQEGIDEGSLRECNPKLGARIIVSLALGLLMQALFDPGGTDWGRESKESIHLLMDGLVRRHE
jgi:AcrR family transcriptional regulator